MIGWELPPLNSGGLGVACQSLAEALAQKKQDLEIIFITPWKINVKIPGVRIMAISRRLKNYKQLLQLSYATKLVKSVNFIKAPLNHGELYQRVLDYARHIKKIVSEQDFDLIHAHDWLTFPAALEAKKMSGKPLIIHVHATEFDRTGGGEPNPLVYQIEQQAFEEADHIVSVSQFTKNIIAQKYQISPEKITPVYNGINLTSSAKTAPTLAQYKAEGYKIVLFVGRLTIQKGVDYLIKAAQQVLKKAPKTLFLIVGSGDMEQHLIWQTAGLQIDQNFIFTGFLRGDDLSQVYRAADIFVMPSVSEPFGLTALEATLHHNPVILSKQSGVSEILNHALKVDFWDTDELANKIIALLRDPILRKTLVKNARREIAKYTWHKAAEQCLRLYHNLQIHTT